ncbi:Uncharacterised protein [Klebsiella pneumoniae]|nr:Uncharacterised protein [Klebsiella pneumoniae]
MTADAGAHKQRRQHKAEGGFHRRIIHQQAVAGPGAGQRAAHPRCPRGKSETKHPVFAPAAVIANQPGGSGGENLIGQAEGPEGGFLFIQR